MVLIPVTRLKLRSLLSSNTVVTIIVAAFGNLDRNINVSKDADLVTG